MISRAVSCKGALENFSKTTNCTRYLLRARGRSNSGHAVKISFALPLRDAFFMYIITK